MVYLYLLIAITASADMKPATTAEQKKDMDRPTYEKANYASQVKTNLILGRQWMPILFEDFESGSIPGDWTVVDGNADGYMWQIEPTSTWHSNAMPGDSGVYIVAYDDDAAGTNPATEEELIPPAFSTVVYDSVGFIYSFGYQNFAGYDTFAIRVRTHDGASWGFWSNLALYYTDMGSGLWDTLDLSSYLPTDSMQVEFNWWDHHSSHYSWYVAVDNVELYGHLGGGGMYDIGVLALNSPPPLMKLDSIYDVTSTFMNFGDSAMTFDAHTEITDMLGTTVYFQYDSFNISLDTDSTIAINFGTWTMTVQDDYIYKTYTMTPDSFPGNDTMQTNLYTVIDVGVSVITSPPEGPVGTGDYDIIGNIHNYGNNPAAFDVTANVYDTTDAWNLIFTETITLTDFPAGADSSHNFGTVNFADDKVFYTEIYTQLTDDGYPGNDTASVYSRTALGLGDVVYELDVETPTGCNRLLGVEFDGTYFYVTGACDPPGNSVYVIDTLGNLVWAPLQNTSTTWGWRDIAWDDVHTGTDRIDTLYASDENSLVKFGIDLTTGTLTNYGTIAGPVSPCRGLAWKGDSAWFFTANWSSPVFKFSKTNPKIDSTLNTYSIYGAAYDTDTADGGWVWWHSQDDAGTGFNFDCQIEQFDPITMSFTGTNFGYVPTLDSGMAGGLCFYEDFRGMDVLFALVQGSPVDEIVGLFVRWEGPSGVEEDIEETATYLSIPSSIGMGELMFTFCGDKPTTLFVRDILGRVVKEYKNVRPGTALSFGRNGISSGIYFISVEGSRRSSKVTLIR